MPHTVLPAHLIEIGGVKRCSLCKHAFPADAKPSLSKAFRKHVEEAHLPAKPRHGSDQDAARIVGDAAEKN